MDNLTTNQKEQLLELVLRCVQQYASLSQNISMNGGDSEQLKDFCAETFERVFATAFLNKPLVGDWSWDTYLALSPHNETDIEGLIQYVEYEYGDPHLSELGYLLQGYSYEGDRTTKEGETQMIFLPLIPTSSVIQYRHMRSLVEAYPTLVQDVSWDSVLRNLVVTLNQPLLDK